MLARNTILIFACLVALAPPGLPEELSAEQRRLDLESFDHVWTTVRDRHWDPALNGLDWNAVGRELRPRVETAETTEQVRQTLNEMISRLDQSHFAVFPQEIFADIAPDGSGPLDGVTGLDVRVIDLHALVTSVEPGSPAAAAGVRTGWEIVGVDGSQTRPRLEEIAGELEGKSWKDGVLSGAANRRLRGPVGEETTVRFLDGDQREVERTLVRAQARGKRHQIGYLPPVQIWIDHERLASDVGYIAFNMFLDPVHVMPEFNAAMQSFLDAEGVVIDVRGNPGGMPEMVMGMCGWLIEEKNHHLGTVYMRETELKIVVNPRLETFAGPVAILVDGLSGSASELFSGGLQDLGRARIFGARTMGAVLPSVVEKLPNGDGFQYAIAGYVSAGGDVLEGKGVVPDEAVTPTREALLEGRDPALEAAVAWIRDQSDAADTGTRQQP